MMKRVGLFILSLFTIFLVGSFVYAREDFTKNLFTKPFESHENITNGNGESSDIFSDHHTENVKEGLNEANKGKTIENDHFVITLFQFSKYCIIFGICWLIFMGIILSTKSGIKGYILKKIEIAIMHIKIFILGIFKFSWINEEIDLHCGELKGDFSKKFPVIIQYEPPKGLNSAEVGFLLYRKVRTKDLFSLIYGWKADGFIDIKLEGNSKIVITRLHMMPSNYKNYEENLFDVLIPYEKTVFEKYISRCPKFYKGSLEDYGIDKGWFTKDSYHSKTIIDYIIRFLLLAYIPSLIIFYLVAGDGNIVQYGLGGILCLFFIIIILKLIDIIDEKIFHFINRTPTYKETEQGAKLIAHILGYRKFLASCDENKLKILLEKDPSYFDKILPYATVFGLKNKLIKKISPLMQDIPSSTYNLENFQYFNPESEYTISIGFLILFVGGLCMFLSVFLPILLLIIT